MTRAGAIGVSETALSAWDGHPNSFCGCCSSSAVPPLVSKIWALNSATS